jgi:predicted dehydrogenase
LDRLKTALIGFGKIGQGYASDVLMAQHYRFATHAQVLKEHPKYDWQLVIDPDPQACSDARDYWKIPNVGRDETELRSICQNIDIAVIAAPPDKRKDVFSIFPNLKALIIEKPLLLTRREANQFLGICKSRNIKVQVNLWRRSDLLFRALANGYLGNLIGEIQAVFGIYGNGIRNNGTHIIDMIRLLLGEVQSVERSKCFSSLPAGPIKDDINVGVTIRTDCGVGVVLSPLNFDHYRENGLQFWGTNGRLDILNEGLVVLYYPKKSNRAMEGQFEITNDSPVRIESTVGTALYNLYDNLSNTLCGKADLFSPIESALVTEQLINEIVGGHKE